MNRIRWVFMLIVLMGLTSLAGALIGQHVYNLWPCPWCVLIRMEVSLIILLSLIVFFFFFRRNIFWIGSVLILLTCVAGLASSAWMQWGGGQKALVSFPWQIILSPSQELIAFGQTFLGFLVCVVI